MTLAGLGSASALSAQVDSTFSRVTVDDVLASDAIVMPDVWTYDNCVDWAVINNTDLRQTLLSILQADEDVAAAKDEWLPSVNFGTTQGFTNYPSPATGARGNTYNSSYGVNASWTVWEGNIRKFRLESSKLLRRQQELSGEDAVKELRLAILSAYLNILYAEEAVEIARQTLEVSTAQAERARKLMEAGRGSTVDVAQIESQRAQDEYSLVQAMSNLDTEKMTLKKVLALGLDYSLTVKGVTFSDAAVTAELPPMEATYQSAVAWLPEFKSNEISKEIYSNDVKIAKAGRAPNISLQGSVGTGYMSGGRSWSSQMGHGINEYLGLSLSIPIYDGNKTKRAVAKANLAALEYDINRDRLLDNLSQTIESLYIQARNAKAKYTAGTSRLESAELTAKLVNRQFELGLVNPLELLTAHNNLLSARLEQLQNKYMAILADKTIQFYNTRQITMP